jgi:ATP-dependent DNA helicase RecQ
LNEKSKAVLFQGEAVYLPAPLQETKVYEPVIYQSLDYEKNLLAELKQIRNRLARLENVPPYLIFSDSTLLDLCTYLPITRDDISKIAGFGTFKTEKYGSHFLHPIQDYCISNQLATRINQLPGRKIKRNPAPGNTAAPKSDTRKVSLELYKEGLSIEEIAERRQLSSATIEQHFCDFVSRQLISIHQLVTETKQQQIRAAANQVGRLRLKAIKDALPDDISYGDIKLTLAAFPD